ncbi:hypothetical protein ACFFMM_00515 [Micromonospora chaiyaphumensis]|uniref:Ubiquitin-like domain-containing protein n=1 Tax=Micromonospora chaiyaphumensis TaxID=307119 RepID=A0A1C4ZN01_9ACTN|nr:hypothetical protein [Micromonospora chaiyaphumensis]SCF34164.1 hypothetical protein GA0070214_11782 [Micromonospora chaiyaphumensis]
MTTEIEEKKPHPGGPLITVTVFAPRSPEPKTFQFRRNDTVGEAARQVADAFGYQAGNPSLATDDQVVLDRDKTLAGAQVRDGDQLHLVDVGGGV